MSEARKPSDSKDEQPSQPEEGELTAEELEGAAGGVITIGGGAAGLPAVQTVEKVAINPLIVPKGGQLP